MLLTGVATVDQLWPPFVDASTAMLTQQKPFFGLKLVNVVYTFPSGVTCGRRYVIPCGLCGGTGSA